MKVVLLMSLLLVLAAGPVTAEQSNPDGKLHSLVITALGGFGAGNLENSIFEDRVIYAQEGDLSRSLLSVEILYPTNEFLSLMVRYDASWLEQKYPPTSDFFESKQKANSYTLIFGIRIFSK